jgi:hypothetical protein
MDVTSFNLEFIATPKAIHWVGQYLDQTNHRRGPLFNAYEAAAMRTMERLAEAHWPPPAPLHSAIQSSQRLSGIALLIPEGYVY